jgi:hypothetical protein
MKIILCYAVRLGPGRGSDLDSIRVENKSLRYSQIVQPAPCLNGVENELVFSSLIDA